MFKKLKGVEERFLEIEKRLSDPKIVKDRQAYQRLIREHAELNKIVSVFNEYLTEDGNGAVARLLQPGNET